MPSKRAHHQLLGALITLGGLAFCVAAWAADLVPVPLRAAIIVRAAGFEHSFAERSGDAVLLVVSGKSGLTAEDGREMADALKRLLVSGRIAGRKLNVVTIEHESIAATVEALKSQRAEIVYISKGLEQTAESIPAQEGTVKRILVCASGADVHLGCTLGVERVGQKPQLVLNLKQASKGGLRFDPGLLRLARIVR